MISAYFGHDGTRIEGDEIIIVERHTVSDNDSIWWFGVKPLNGYVFTRFPVSQAGVSR